MVSERSGARVAGRLAASGVLKSFLLCSLASLLITYLWTINKQRLADFYDYSIYSYSGAFLKIGLKPYVDFQTPIQTLPYRLCWWAESLWGERLSSLANANLLFALMMFLTLYALLRKWISSVPAIVIALSSTVTTALQHGIIWHNPLGLWMLMVTTLLSADMIRRRQTPVIHLVAAFCLIAASAMTKLNYCVTAAVIFGLALLFLAQQVAGRRLRLLVAAILLPAAACGTGLAIEILSTGVSPAAWFHQCVVIPSSRTAYLKSFLTPGFWLGSINSYYRFNAFRGMFALAGALYLYAGWQRGRFIPQPFLAAAALALLWLFGAVIAVSNGDLPSMGAAFLPVAVVAVGLAFASWVNSRRFIVSGVSLALIYLLMGSVSLFMHTRLLYGPAAWFEHAPPFIDGPHTGFLSGVRLTPRTEIRLNTVVSFLRQHAASTQRVVWGPGMEIFARQYGTAPIVGLPLWFHLKTTVEESDTKRIVAAWNAAGVTAVVMDEYWARELPQQLRDYLTATFHERRSGGVLVYDRSAPGSPTVASELGHS